MARGTPKYLLCMEIREQKSSLCFCDFRQSISPTTPVMLGAQMVGNRANVKAGSKCYKDNFDPKGDQCRDCW